MNRTVLRHPSSLAVLAAGVLLGGCASTQMGAQYLDPQASKQALRGVAVLVVCEAPEPAIRLICEGEVTAQLTQLGAKPLTDPKLVGLTSGREPTPDQYLLAAKAAGAQALFSVTLAPDFWRPSPMSAVSLGVGAWGGSGGFSGGSAGVGVSMPVGGSGSASGFAANGSLLDVGSGRVLWSASATASPRGDASAQVGEVVRALTGAVRDTGLF
jgi:hypothetical protein